MNVSLRIRLTLLSLLLIIQPLLAQDGQPKKSHDLMDTLGLRHPHHSSLQPSTPTPDPIAMGLAKAKVYHFLTYDYPGAGLSEILDVNSSTLLGCFEFNSTSGLTAFTFGNGGYKMLPFPGAIWAQGLGINTAGLIVGGYADSSNVGHGFLYDGSVFTTIDVPGASSSPLYSK